MGSTSESIYGWKLKQLINVGVSFNQIPLPCKYYRKRLFGVTFSENTLQLVLRWDCPHALW